MAVSKQVTIGLASLAAVTVLAVGGSSMAMAEDATSGQSLVDRIATKFNLNKDEVKAVFNEEHAERQAERLAEVSQDLQTAVDAGELTSDQKTLIENKMKDNQAARTAEITALQEWADSNNIDMKYLMGKGRHGSSDTRLQNAVDNGNITPEQKTLIEQKQAELEKAREAKRTEMQQWAQDNNIDEEYLHIGRGEHGGGPRGGR